jgi:hypothetical protein
MALWLPGSWLLGHFFGPAMLAASGLLFLVFDAGLPVLAAVSAFGRKNQGPVKDDMAFSVWNIFHPARAGPSALCRTSCALFRTASWTDLARWGLGFLPARG